MRNPYNLQSPARAGTQEGRQSARAFYNQSELFARLLRELPPEVAMLEVAHRSAPATKADILELRQMYVRLSLQVAMLKGGQAK